MRFYNYLLNTLTLISLAVSARPRSRSGSLNISDSENGSDLDQFALEGRASTDMSSSSSSTISPLIELPPPTHKLIDGGVETRGFPESLIQSTPPTSTPSITPIDTKAAAVSLLAKHFQLALSTGNILEMEQIFTSASPTTQRLFITTEIPVIMSRQTFAQQTEMVFLFAKFSGEEVSPLLTAMLERSPELVRAKDR